MLLTEAYLEKRKQTLSRPLYYKNTNYLIYSYNVEIKIWKLYF